jgi:glycosyltransferase involved in cell wall biosynthesis
VTASLSGQDVAVVIPLFNKAGHVLAALESITRQTIRVAAIIVVDDGSSDGGDRLVEQSRTPGLTLIRQPNAGPGTARNAGMALAKTRYVAFLDADDVWRPDHIARLLDLANAHPTLPLLANRIAAFGVRLREDETSGGAPAFEVIASYADAWLDGLVVSTCAVMVDRQAALAVGGFGTDVHRGEDLALWLKLTLDRAMGLGRYVGALYRQDASELTRMPVAGPDSAMRWIAQRLQSPGDLGADKRALLQEFRARLALLHAAEWIKAGGRGKACEFLALARETRRNRRLRRQLQWLAGPLWPLRKWIIGLRRLR